MTLLPFHEVLYNKNMLVHTMTWKRKRENMNSEIKRVENVLQLLQELSEEPKKYLEEFLVNAPVWLLSSFYLRRLEKNRAIVRENEPVDRAYILLEGCVKGVDYQNRGENFEYMWFYPISVFGSMEILLNIGVYRTTLKTSTPCLLLEISRNLFEKWMHSDIHALLMEINTIGNSLLKQVKQSRGLLFTEGRERLLIFLARSYGKVGEASFCISATRQQMADCTGLSVRTVNRLLKELEEESLIERKGSKVCITDLQFQEIAKQLPDVWNEFL